jgi:hypothetical protein
MALCATFGEACGYRTSRPVAQTFVLALVIGNRKMKPIWCSADLSPLWGWRERLNSDVHSQSLASAG